MPAAPETIVNKAPAKHLNPLLFRVFQHFTTFLLYYQLPKGRAQLAPPLLTFFEDFGTAQNYTGVITRGVNSSRGSLKGRINQDFIGMDHNDSDDIGVADASPESSEIYLASSFYCACVMVFLCVIGLIGNGLSIYVFSRKQMRSSINILLTGLSVSDFFLLLVVVPIFALNPLLERRTAPVMLNNFINYMYVYAYPVAMILQTNSVWIFLVITAERFMAVCHPLQVGIYCTQKRAVLALLVVFFLAVCYNSIRFWEYKIIYCPEPPFVSNLCLSNNTVVSDYDLKNNQSYWLLYGTIAYLITQFLAPCLVIAALNGCVIRTMWLAKRQRAQLTMTEKSEHKTALMMVMIIVIFVLCYTLSFVLNFAEALDRDLFIRRSTKAMAYLLNDISNTLVVANSATTTFIYVIFSKRYRQIAKWVTLHWMPARVLKHFVSDQTIADLENGIRRKGVSVVTQTACVRSSPSSGGRSCSARGNPSPRSVTKMRSDSEAYGTCTMPLISENGASPLRQRANLTINLPESRLNRCSPNAYRSIHFMQDSLKSPSTDFSRAESPEQQTTKDLRRPSDHMVHKSVDGNQVGAVPDLIVELERNCRSNQNEMRCLLASPECDIISSSNATADEESSTTLENDDTQCENEQLLLRNVMSNVVSNETSV